MLSQNIMLSFTEYIWEFQNNALWDTFLLPFIACALFSVGDAKAVVGAAWCRREPACLPHGDA